MITNFEVETFICAFSFVVYLLRLNGGREPVCGVLRQGKLRLHKYGFLIAYQCLFFPLVSLFDVLSQMCVTSYSL